MRCQCTLSAFHHYAHACRNEADWLAYNLSIVLDQPSRTIFLCSDCLRDPYVKIKRLA